jgi:DNA end-binding protein Ku
MAARAIASGTISFGLVAVPVKLFTATQSKHLSFNLLHGKDGARLKQQYVCQGCGEVVGRDDMVRGYEYAKDQYAVFTEAELKALEQSSDQSIEIEAFVPIESIDAQYFDKAYLLGPDKGGQKAYRLLREAMAKAGRAAVAKYSSRGRQQLVLVREARGGLMMHALFYADEVRDFADIERGDEAALKDGEVDLAIKLIEQLGGGAFDAGAYEDEYRARTLQAIEQKVAGQEVTVAPSAAPKGQIIDLMEALKASLAAGAGSGRGAAAAARKPARAKGAAAVAAPAKRARKSR